MPAPLVPDLTLLRSYSAEDDLVERPPVISHFTQGGRDLFFINAHHGVGTRNPTCDAIRRVFDTYDPRFLVIEGFASAQGVNPKRFIARLPEWGVDEFAKGGENAVAASIAQLRDIPFQGGEPSDAELFDVARAHGYSSLDYAGHQLLLYIGHDLSAGLVASEGEHRALMGKRLKVDFPYMDQAEIPTLDTFLEWVARHNGHCELMKTTTTDYMPSGDADANFLQRLTNSMTRARDAHLLRLIASRLDEYGRVLVVYGDGHLVTCRAVLEDMLGQPVVL